MYAALVAHNNLKFPPFCPAPCVCPCCCPLTRPSPRSRPPVVGLCLELIPLRTPCPILLLLAFSHHTFSGRLPVNDRPILLSSPLALSHAALPLHTTHYPRGCLSISYTLPCCPSPPRDLASCGFGWYQHQSLDRLLTVESHR